ncbi:MAG: hypothetical protein R3Y43_00115 [Alphaproteobacteria bacterium]
MKKNLFMLLTFVVLICSTDLANARCRNFYSSNLRYPLSVQAYVGPQIGVGVVYKINRYRGFGVDFGHVFNFSTTGEQSRSDFEGCNELGMSIVTFEYRGSTYFRGPVNFFGGGGPCIGWTSYSNRRSTAYSDNSCCSGSRSAFMLNATGGISIEVSRGWTTALQADMYYCFGIDNYVESGFYSSKGKCPLIFSVGVARSF